MEISEMSTKKIIVFLGSTREGRLGEKVARYVENVLKNTGLSAKVFGKLVMHRNKCSRCLQPKKIKHVRST